MKIFRRSAIAKFDAQLAKKQPKPRTQAEADSLWAQRTIANLPGPMTNIFRLIEENR